MFQREVAEKTFGDTGLAQFLRNRWSHAFDFRASQDSGVGHVGLLFRRYCVLFTAGVSTAVVLGHCESGAGRVSFHGATDTLVEIRQASQRESVVRIDAARGFVVTNRVVFTSEPLEHLRGVEISG